MWLLTLQVEEVGLAGAPQHLREDRAPVGPEPLGRERVMVVHALPREIQTRADCVKIQTSVEEGLHESQLDQIAEAKLKLSLESGQLRCPQWRHAHRPRAMAIGIAAQPTSDVSRGDP